VELVKGICCGYEWVGDDRAHCCGRTPFGGCTQVFDDVTLFDLHRQGGRCADPRQLGLISKRNGVWVRAFDLLPSA
jgi:hypothetical protein